MTSTTSRLTQQDYYEVALRLLAGGSHDALTIATLCDELGVSKGSFYHHFGGWSGFVTALLETWERQSTLGIKKAADQIDAVGTKYRLLSNLIDVIPHDAEAALRVWSHTDPAVMAAIVRVDAVRTALVADFFALTVPEQDAIRLADLYLSTLVGTQFSHRPVDTRRMGTLLDQLTRMTEAFYGPGVFGAAGD